MANIVNLPTKSTSEAWLPLLRKSMRKIVEGDFKQTFLPSNLLPSQGQRRALQTKVDAIRECLTKDTDDARRKALALGRMWLAFPVQAMSEEAATERSKLYLQALSDFAAWPVEKACERWLKGDAGNGMGDVNFAFAPSPPQLVLLSKDCAEQATVEAVAYQELLDARPNLEPETAEQLNARAAFIDAMKATHGENMGVGIEADEDAKKRKAIQGAQIKRASDILRARDFEAAGLPVPPEGSLEPSPMLLRALEGKKQERAA